MKHAVPQVCFVDQSGHLGGAELCLADLASMPGGRVVLLSDGPFVGHLKKRGVPCEVVAMPTAMARATKSGSPLGLVARLPALLGFLTRLRSATASADLLYLNTAKALLLGMAANVLRKTPSVFHLHDFLSRGHFSLANIKLLVQGANRSAVVIANSRATAEQFRAAGGTVRVEVIPNGFDPEVFRATPRARVEEIRSELNPEGGVVAAIFGRIARWKGQDLVVEALASVPNVTLWVAGDALFTDDDRRFFEELKRSAEPCGARCRFLGFRDDVADLMAAADIVVHASREPEPFGRVIVEAMLAGKPVVASAAGGPLEIVNDGVTGVLVPPGDVPALASAMQELALSSALRETMGTAGRARAESLYSLPVIQAQTRRVIESVISA